MPTYRAPTGTTGGETLTGAYPWPEPAPVSRILWTSRAFTRTAQARRRQRRLYYTQRAYSRTLYPQKHQRRARPRHVEGTNTRIINMGSIARTPVVAGMLLGDSTAEITAELFRYPNLTTPVTSLTTSLGRTWSDVLSDVGSGGIGLLLDDSAVASFVEDGNDVVVFSYRGLRAFAMLVEGKTEDTVAEDEESAERVTYTGRGVLALLARSPVYPSVDVGRQPVEEDRLFNWTAQEYVDTSWATVAVSGTINDAVNVAAFLLTINGTPTDPSEINVNLPQTDLSIYWANTGVAQPLVDQPPGDCYFRDGTFVPADASYIVYFYCDDNGELYIDGQQVAEVSGLNWIGGGIASVTVDMTGGFHTIAAHVQNSSDVEPSATNGAAVGWAIYAPNTILGSTSAGTLVDQMHSTAKVVAYPASPPGMTVGQAMILALTEAQARGELTGVTWNFTETTDSGGVPWPTVADIATKTGTDMLTFFRELSATYIDMWMDPATLTLWAWNIDGRGQVKSAIAIKTPTNPADPTTGNIRAYQKTGEFMPIGAILLRSRFGWSERTDATSIAAYGRTGAMLEIGAPVSVAEVNRMADGQFVYFADPRTEANATIMPISNADAPYWAYTNGDQLTTPDGVLRLLATTMEEDPDTGLAIPTLTFGSIILGAEERVFQALNKVR